MHEGAHQFWASVLRGWVGGRQGWGGVEGGGISCLTNCPEKLHSEDMDTRAVHLVSGEA